MKQYNLKQIAKIAGIELSEIHNQFLTNKKLWRTYNGTYQPYTYKTIWMYTIDYVPAKVLLVLMDILKLKFDKNGRIVNGSDNV